MLHFDRNSAKLLALVAVLGCAGPSVTTPPNTPTGGRATATPELTASAAPVTSTAPPQTGQPTPTTTPPATAATETPTTTATATAGLSPTPTPASTAATAWRELDVVGVAPSAREDHTWTTDEGDVGYLFGGRAADGPSNELWEFNLVTGGWTLLEPSGSAPAARWGHTATWVPSVGLVVWSGQGPSAFFDDTWVYEPVANAWRELPSLGAVPAARYGSCASLGPDGEMWISHGFTADGGRFADTRSYDFASGSWTDRTPLDSVPVERCLHDCFWASNGQLILYGGQTTGVAALGDIWAYDPSSGAWTKGPESGAPPRQLYSLAVVPIGGVVFGGGSADGGFLDDMWSIDPVRLEMFPMDVPGTIPPERSGATLIDAGPRALLFGGKNEDGLLGDLWEFGPI